MPRAFFLFLLIPPRLWYIEIMRFLITSKELNEMAQNKGLMSPTKDLSFNRMYAAFGTIPESQILSP